VLISGRDSSALLQVVPAHIAGFFVMAEAGQVNETEEDICAICHELPKEKGIVKPCDHQFCWGCVNELVSVTVPRCPLCRRWIELLVNEKKPEEVRKVERHSAQQGSSSPVSAALQLLLQQVAGPFSSLASHDIDDSDDSSIFSSDSSSDSSSEDEEDEEEVWEEWPEVEEEEDDDCLIVSEKIVVLDDEEVSTREARQLGPRDGRGDALLGEGAVAEGSRAAGSRKRKQREGENVAVVRVEDVVVIDDDE